MPEIKSLSHTHVEIMDYMMANPSMNLGDVARHFGYTQPWLSCIIHSDAFQTMLREKQNTAFHHTVLPIREKITQVAHQTLDKLANMLPNETDVRTVAQVADSMLDRIGFGSKPINGNTQINIQNNTLIAPNANSEEIARAREMLLAKNSSLGVTVHANPNGALPGESTPTLGSSILEGHFSPADGANHLAEEGLAVRAEGSREAAK